MWPLGETVPLRAIAESMVKNYLETPCIGMAGTHCVSGSAVGVVVATGDRSVFGRVSPGQDDQMQAVYANHFAHQLAKLTSTPNTDLTLLEKEIYYFVATIVAIMLTMVLVVVVVWYE